MTHSMSLLAKLGSIAVHADELSSKNVDAVRGHEFDKIAIRQLIADPEITAWIKEMGPLLPVKRSAK